MPVGLTLALPRPLPQGATRAARPETRTAPGVQLLYTPIDRSRVNNAGILNGFCSVAAAPAFWANAR